MCNQSPDDFIYYGKWLSLSDVRRSIHVGNLTYNDGLKVEKYLIPDLMKSVKPQLTEAMNYYKVCGLPAVLIFTAQCTLLCVVQPMLLQAVRLSVCLSATCRYSIKTVTHILKLFHHTF